MNEREGKKRLILRIDKRNDCFGRGREEEIDFEDSQEKLLFWEREREIERVVWKRRMRSWGVI